jgi:thymidylate synthase
VGGGPSVASDDDGGGGEIPLPDAPPSVGFHAEAATIDDLMRSVIERALSAGEPIAPTKGGARDLTGASLVLLDPRARLSRSEARGRATSAIAEFCWYAGGSGDLEHIAHYLPKYRDNADGDGSLRGAYGPRMFGPEGHNQVRRVAEALRHNRHSRKAVIQILRENDIGSGQRDVPCTIALQFAIRFDLLYLVVYMRSNDIWWGMPHDIFAFTMIQELIARDLGVELGSYVHMVGSLHLYERHIERAGVFLGEGYQPRDQPMPSMPEGAPWDGLSELIRAESELRTGVPPESARLPEEGYWRDLAMVLAIREAVDRGEDERVEAMTRDLSGFYRLFIEDRLDRKGGA